jgi:Porphobilinogen deaminase
VDAVVVAMAALDRLEFTDLAEPIFDPQEMVPHVGQGAIALECRADDSETIGSLSQLVDDLTGRCVTADRSFLAELGGGCGLPVGAFAYDGPGPLFLDPVLASLDGSPVLRTPPPGDDPILLGAQTAPELLACGGYFLLASGGVNA